MTRELDSSPAELDQYDRTSSSLVEDQIDSGLARMTHIRHRESRLTRCGDLNK